MVDGSLLRGEKVWLTALDRNAVPIIARWEQDIEFLRLLDASPARPRTEDEIARWIDGEQRSSSNFLFAIRLLDTDELIGWVELDGVLWTHGVSSLGIAIGSRSSWGKGYGAEAMALVLDFAFRELNLHGIHITVFSYNQRAIKLYENLGFQREGVYREYLHRDGQRHDMLLYGILRREWESRLSTLNVT
jgi:RimJ/RimL family protein N-acetyltransferase